MKQFVTREHEIEPVPGLPARLPEGETLLWQGRPSARLVARHVLKTRWIAAYFGLLVVWAVASGWSDGHPAGGILFSVAILVALAAVLIGLLELFAWGVERTTLYTITSHRIVMRFGVALSMTLNLPYRQVAAVALGRLSRRPSARAGTLAVALAPGHRLSWLVQWPHVRGLRLAAPEPALICLEDAVGVADILALAIAQHEAGRSGHARVVPATGERRGPAASVAVAAAE